MNNAPQSSKLDEIIQATRLNHLWNECDKYADRAGGLTPTEARTQILALIEEVIGEDEPMPTRYGKPIPDRNKLRAEMRLRKEAL